MCVCCGFSAGQPGFLYLWHIQQSFLLSTTGEWTRQHNSYHLGIMRTSSMKWSCRAWQLRTMGGRSGHQREPCSRSTEGAFLYQGWTIRCFPSLCILQPVNGAEEKNMEEESIDGYPMWFVLSEISSSRRTLVDSWTRLRNFCNTGFWCRCEHGVNMTQ